MSLKSDLNISKDKFSEDAIPKASVELNGQLIEIMSGIPKWYEVYFVTAAIAGLS
jgi:hypothetical protein